jgi:hypothetical protein
LPELLQRRFWITGYSNVQWAEPHADRVRGISLPRANVHDFGTLKLEAMPVEVLQDGWHLQVDACCGFGVWISQRSSETEQFPQIVRVKGEVFLIASVINRLQRLLLRDEVPIKDIANLPAAFAILPIPVTLPADPLANAARPANVALDNSPGHKNLSSVAAIRSGQATRRKGSGICQAYFAASRLPPKIGLVSMRENLIAIATYLKGYSCYGHLMAAR